MPSHLRVQSSFEPTPAAAIYQTSPTLSSANKQKMSITQTYYVASTARSKLGREASRADHNLRLLVGHANLLDTLMIELADAEREQEAWFNQSVKKASKPEPRQHIQWVDTITELEEEEEESDDSDLASNGSSDIYDEDMFDLPQRPILNAPVLLDHAPVIRDFASMPIQKVEEHDEQDYDDEYDEELTLTRTPSHHSPPELTLDLDSESDDESMPSSPESSVLELTEKQRQMITTTSFYDMKDVIQQRTQPQQTLITAC